MGREFSSSYDSEEWEVTVYIDGKMYIYTGVSRYHNHRFTKLAKSNKGRAMTYIKFFRQKPPSR